MSGIFLSYRRDDAPDAAGRLADGLVARFGADRVFVDVDSIEVGLDFQDRIHQALSECDALLAIIGPGWLSATDADGRSRLDDPHDYVRREVEAGLSRDDVRVIPVLVDGAAIPSVEQLPPSLADLAQREALEIRRERWHNDVEILHAALARVTGRRAHWKRGRKQLGERYRDVSERSREHGRLWADWSKQRAGALAARSKAETAIFREPAERSYETALTVDEVTRSLQAFYRAQRLDTQAVVKPDGTLLQARRRGRLRDATSLDATLNIVLRRDGEQLVVTLSPGTWAEKSALRLSSIFPILPLVTSAVGMWLQKDFVERTIVYLEETIARGTGDPHPTPRVTTKQT